MAENILLPSYTGVTALSDLGVYALVILTTEEMFLTWQDGINDNIFVEFDGVMYECAPQRLVAMDNVMAVGNCAAFGGTGNGEPFVISIITGTDTDGQGNVSANYAWIIGALTDTAPAEHTVEIYQVEASTAFAVVLKDRSGADATYEVPSEQIKLNTPDGTQIFTAGQAVENVPITLDLADGDQTINAPDGYLVKSAVIQKPTTLVPANIVKNVDIAGVVGTFEGGGGNDAVLAGLIDNTVTEIVIPEGATKIRDYAFYGCTSLTSVTIPDSVTSIGERAFYNCTSLTSVTIPDSVTNIGYGAFNGCKALTSITIPDSVTSIGGAAFFGCNSLTSVTIGNGVTSIGTQAFQNCTSLTSIIIPDSVTSIGTQAFQNCTSLTSATFKITSGWWVSTSSTATSGTTLSSSNLANTSTAATYLKSTYKSYYWKRS